MPAAAILGAAILAAAPCVGRGQAAPASVGGDESLSLGATFSAYHLDYGSRTLLGTGVFVDASLTRNYGLEADVRWLNLRERADAGAATYLAGPRYVFTSRGRLRPYVRFLAGDGHFSFPYHYAEGNYLVLAPGAGVDFRLNSRFRLRLADVEYQYWNQFTYGSLSPFGVSTGISYMFHGR